MIFKSPIMRLAAILRCLNLEISSNNCLILNEDNIIKASILTEKERDEAVFGCHALRRIWLLNFKRRRFPVRLRLWITFNQSQWQSIKQCAMHSFMKSFLSKSGLTQELIFISPRIRTKNIDYNHIWEFVHITVKL